MSDSSTNSENAGIPENTSLLVKPLGAEWIVEDEVGDCLGSAKDRQGAIDIALKMRDSGRGSSISVHGADGDREETITQ